MTRKTAAFDEFDWTTAPSAGEGELDRVREHMDRIQRRRSQLDPDDRTWFTIPEKGTDGLFIKVFRHDSFLQRSRYTLFGSQADTEWKHLLRLHDRSLPVPPPVALGQSSSSGLLNTCILVTRNLGGRTLREVIQELYGTSEWVRMRSHIWKALADVTAQFIDAGFHHRDYHDQNIVVTPEHISGDPDVLSLHVTDLHRASVSAELNPDQISSMLAFMLYSLRDTVPLWECRRFFRKLETSPVMQRHGPEWKQVMEDLHKRRREHLRRRTKSCFREHEHVAIYTLDDTWKVHSDPGVSRDRVRSWIREIEMGDTEDITVLNQRPDGRVCRMNRDDVVVEETSGRMFGRTFQRAIGQSRPRKIWKNMYGLRLRDVPAPEGVALVEPRNPFSARSSYLIREYVPGNGKDDLLKELRDREPGKMDDRCSLIDASIRFVSRLHSKGVFHKNLTANHLLVPSSAPPWRIYLIDLERVDFYDRPLPESPRLKNLVQLNASLHEVLSRQERERAWQQYLSWPGVPFGDSREIRREITERSREHLSS